jgi:hypothetical protein
MKNSLKIVFSVLLTIVLLTSFTFYYTQKEKPEPLTGTEQIFVQSFKKIKNAPLTMPSNSFRHKSNDSIIEGFQMLDFDYTNNKVVHQYLCKKNGEDVMEKFTLDISLIKNDGEFALYKIVDNSGYYNDIVEKYIIINLNNNEKFPKLQYLWKEGNKINGAYSVDTRDFLEQFRDIKENVFKD